MPVLSPLIFLFLASFSFGLGALVYFKAQPDSVRRYFVVFTFSISVWLVCGFVLYSNIDAPRSVLWAKIAFASGSVIILSLYHLLLLFPDLDAIPAEKHSIFLRFLGISFVFLSIFSPWLVRHVSYQGIFKIRVDYGPLYLPFTAYALIAIAIGVNVLLKRLQNASGRRKLQIQYFLLGAAIPAVGVCITNLLLLLIFKMSSLAPYGRFLAIVFLPMTAHAIIRYRLMNIKVVILKGVVYFCAIVAAASAFTGFTVALSWALGYNKDSIPLTIAMAMAVLVAIFFPPLKTWIQDLLNRYIYRATYDYQRTVREVSRRLSNILDLHSLLSHLSEVIAKTLKVEMVAVYLRDHLEQPFTPKVIQHATEWQQGSVGPVLSGTSPLVEFLERENKILVRDEVRRDSTNQLVTAAAQELQALGGDIVFPLFQNHTIYGFLIAGPKLSGDPYFSDDIDLLTTLVSQAAISIKNAQLYHQIVLTNEYIENILATMESGVVAVGADGTVTLFNPAAERMTQLDAKNIKGGPLQNLPVSLAAPLERTLADGQPRLQVETIIQDDAGNLTPVICSTSTLKDRSRTILGAMAVFSDLTKLKELEGEKRQAERLASIGALASGVAHEIKNPLVAIKTFAELLPERFSEEDFRDEFSKVVIREIERIDGLVARLKGLAAPLSQPFTLLDLRGPVEETLALLHGQTKQAQITVKSVYEGEPPLITGDSAQLKQLFLNLFLNALEAMGPGGELSIRLASREEAGSQTLVVEISDTGTGVPEILLDKIFEPFFTTKPGGSGLGLSICLGIVNAHGATIRVQNNSHGKGITIVIEFPVVAGVNSQS